MKQLEPVKVLLSVNSEEIADYLRDETLTRLMVVAGTRPEFIKLSPLITQLRTIRQVDLIFIHSGQHFDGEMSETFIKELQLPKPVENFDVGNRPDTQQIPIILGKCESAIRRYDPDMILAEGDTNTVVAVALAATKAQVPLGHVEAGLRSFDRSMPEEINRIVADHCAELCFCPTETSALNLCREGILPQRISITGNTVVDACRRHLSKALASSHILDEIGVDDRFGLVTVHRQENVDNAERLSRIIDALCELDETDLVFPIHPRTQKRLPRSVLKRLRVRSSHIVTCKPVGYFDFLRLLASSVVVLTDSGGVQEEALTLRTPCVTLRDSTERPETIIAGGNRLVGTDPDLIKSAVRDIVSDRERAVASIAQENPLGDGKAGERIARLCVSYCEGPSPIANDFKGNEIVRSTLLAVEAEDHETTVMDFCQRIAPATISVIYDRTGRPIFPRPNLRLER